MSVYAYRRGSIFWALILIAVGAIFLYQNINPAVRPWHIIAKYWPILIIFWGLSKLVDYFQARAHPEIAAPPLFSGSEVVLLILVLLLGTLISKVVLRQWPEVFIHDEEFGRLFLNSHTYTQTISKPAQPPTRLLLVTRRGDVEIRASDQSTIEGVIKKTIWATDEQSARKISDQLRIELAEQGGTYLLQSNLSEISEDGRNVRLDITLRVPKATSTEVTADRGDVILDGLRGNQKLTVKRGDVHAANVEGLIKVEKSGALTDIRDVKGNVEVEGRGQDVNVAGVTGAVVVNGDFSGSVQFRNVGQNLRFSSSRTELTAQKLTGRLDLEMGSLELNGIEGPFVVSTKQKDIRVQDFKHSVKITNKNGDVRLRAAAVPAQPIEVDLEKGGIELILPSNSNFQIDAVSRHGEVESEFSGPNLKVGKEREKPSITGSYGKGGPMIRLATSYGTIRLSRHGLLPPTPPQPPAPPAGEKQALNSPQRHPQPRHSGSAHTEQEYTSPLARAISVLCRFNARLFENMSKAGVRVGRACPVW